MKNFHIEYKFKRQNDIVYRIETESISIEEDSGLLQAYHAASLKAMQTLMALDREHVVSGQKLIDYNIIWED